MSNPEKQYNKDEKRNKTAAHPFRPVSHFLTNLLGKDRQTTRSCQHLEDGKSILRTVCNRAYNTPVWSKRGLKQCWSGESDFLFKKGIRRKDARKADVWDRRGRGSPEEGLPKTHTLSGAWALSPGGGGGLFSSEKCLGVSLAIQRCHKTGF